MATLDYEYVVRLDVNTVLIAGLDEAGRGALAGPVTAGAVILPLDNPAALEQLAEVNDSKQLSAAKRETLFNLIVTHVLSWGVGSASAAEIDNHGILPATRLAMQRALGSLNLQPAFLLIDGRIRLSMVTIPQKSIIRGDSLSLSIAAASILAKVSRDREMIVQGKLHPLYNFEQHKGYGTVAHRAAIETHGPCDIHRRTFAPLNNYQLIKGCRCGSTTFDNC